MLKICSTRLPSSWQDIQGEEGNWNIYAETHELASIKCKPSKELTRRGTRFRSELLPTENTPSMVSLCLLNVRLQPFSKHIPCHLGRNSRKKKRASVLEVFLVQGLLHLHSLLRSATKSGSAEGFCKAKLRQMLIHTLVCAWCQEETRRLPL